jgi:hypothetical protein
VFFLLAIAALALGAASWGRVFRTVGRWLLAATYFAAHILVLGVDVVPALGFLTLSIVNVEVGELADRFVPTYERTLNRDARERIDSALVRSMARLGVAASLGLLVPIAAADLALAGLLPTTSVATAVLFAAGLVVVIVLLALLPRSPRAREGSDSDAMSTGKPN